MYGKPKAGPKVIAAAHGIEYVDKEIFVDFVVAQRVTDQRLVPVVGCESEMHPSHGVGYSLDGQNGYTFDFWKLLLFPAPLLVFVAQVSTHNLNALEESLRRCACDYHSYWSESKLYVVLLPSASKRSGWTEVRFGVGISAGQIDFSRLS